MVAKISTGASLYGALAYNQNKVDEGHAKVLAANLILQPEDGNFHLQDCMEDFKNWLPSHYRTEKPVIHISLNPHPDDVLTDGQLVTIGEEYMQKLGYGGQPYLIFKHEDIDRRHIHIVSLREIATGRRLTTVTSSVAARRSLSSWSRNTACTRQKDKPKEKIGNSLRWILPKAI